MGKPKKKRKNSSEGDSAKTSKSNKEAKTGLHTPSPKGVGETLSNSIEQLCLPALPVYMNNMNSSCNGSVFGSPVGPVDTQLYQQNTQVMPGQMTYNPMGMGAGPNVSPGSYQPMSAPPYNMGGIIPPSQPTTSSSMFNGPPPTPTSYQTSISTPSSQNQLAQLLNSKFDEVNKRLDKLDSLEKKVNDIDVKFSKLWSDLDKRVTKNAENITYADNKTRATDIELENTKSNLAALQKQNDTLKETLNDMQSKSMINNLIVGGIKELENESTEQTEAEFRKFLANDLEVPPERINEIKLERAHGIGQRLVHQHRKILAVFTSVKDKTYIKSLRAKLEDTDKFMHDQYPANVVTYRKKLVPILKRAKDDGKEAFIKYNKLIVNGEVYTDGEYGKVPT